MTVVEIKRLQHPNKAGLAYHCGDLNALKGFQPGLPHINIRNRIASININININTNINVYVNVCNQISNISIRNRIANINIISTFTTGWLLENIQFSSSWKSLIELNMSRT